jgi:hypothetical protein
MKEVSNRERYRAVVAAVSLASLANWLGLKSCPVRKAVSRSRFLLSCHNDHVM